MEEGSRAAAAAMQTIRAASAVCLGWLAAEGVALAQVSKLIELNGSARGDRFGRAAVVEDLEQDGVDDFVVGAPRFDGAAGVDSGGVWVYSGRTTALLASWEGEAAGDTLGNAVTSLGDVDGDGCADLLVGCGTGLFEVYAVSGCSGAELFRAVGAGPSDFGLTVDGISDLDGDGYDDFLVGAYAETSGSLSEAGVVWIYSGGAPGTIGNLIDSVHGDAARD